MTSGHVTSRTYCGHIGAPKVSGHQSPTREDSLMRRHSTLRRTVAIATALAGLTLTAACGGNDDPETLPPATTSPSSSSPAISPTPTTPAWESKFTKDQLAEYERALDRWTTYEQRSEPIWASGKATPAAEALFKEFFLNASGQYHTLQTYELAKVKTEGTPKIYWSKATSISDPKKAGTRGMSTVIQQCVNYRSRTVTAMGKPSELAKKFQRPLIREISMIKVGNVTWRIAGVDDLSDRKAEPCDSTL
jgi:hypothetical protein